MTTTNSREECNGQKCPRLLKQSPNRLVLIDIPWTAEHPLRLLRMGQDTNTHRAQIATYFLKGRPVVFAGRRKELITDLDLSGHGPVIRSPSVSHPSPCSFVNECLVHAWKQSAFFICPRNDPRGQSVLVLSKESYKGTIGSHSQPSRQP